MEIKASGTNYHDSEFFLWLIVEMLSQVSCNNVIPKISKRHQGFAEIYVVLGDERRSVQISGTANGQISFTYSHIESAGLPAKDVVHNQLSSMTEAAGELAIISMVSWLCNGTF